MKIAMIGAGNVSSHLCRAFYQRGHRILQIYNRTGAHAEDLALRFHSQWTDKLSELATTADIYVISISDDAIHDMVDRLSQYLPADALIVHTAGNVSSDIFTPHFTHYGVFYPLQSFRKGRKAIFKNIPLCLTASNNESLAQLEKLAGDLFLGVHIMSDEKRQKLHIPAVMVNNYVNYLCALARGYCQNEGLSFEILFPLMHETMDRMWAGEDLSKMQTGPAIRGDTNTIKRHLDELSDYPEARAVYEFMAGHIGKNKMKGCA